MPVRSGDALLGNTIKYNPEILVIDILNNEKLLSEVKV